MSETRLTLADYGAAAAGIAEILIAEEEIAARVRELGAAITHDYAGRNPLLVGVLKGVLPFMADLVRAIHLPLEMDFMAISSYSSESRQRGMVRLEKDLSEPIAARHVIFVEDVVDTGFTLNYLLRSLRAREPSSLEVCALFNKGRRRLIDIPLRYQGFELPDKFVVGYGLDYREQYRNLPFVGLLEAEVFQPGP